MRPSSSFSALPPSSVLRLLGRLSAPCLLPALFRTSAAALVSASAAAVRLPPEGVRGLGALLPDHDPSHRSHGLDAAGVDESAWEASGAPRAPDPAPAAPPPPRLDGGVRGAPAGPARLSEVAPAAPKMGALAQKVEKVTPPQPAADGAPPLVMREESVLQQAAGAAVNSAAVVFGVIFILVAAPIQWFNEERSQRIDTLLSRGLEEATPVDARQASKANRGRLVHVQGHTVAAVQLRDQQFRDVMVSRCLKLQRTVEVFQWVEKSRTRGDGLDRRSRPGFECEWTTSHHDFRRHLGPSPRNPQPPSGLSLGTFTQGCARVELGAFVLTSDMVSSFQKFELAMKYLPPRVTCTNGMTFYANPEDGYFYFRQGFSGTRSPRSSTLFSQHNVGDVRVRFMCVPETDATVVAVQCHKDGDETFVPYRPVPRGPCTEDWRARQSLLEEGHRPMKGSRQDVTCCAGGFAGCCCCACNTIACICASEVITEEICYVSDRLDPIDKPFQWVVHRSPWRVWNFRVLGLFLMFIGTRMILSPFSGALPKIAAMAAYGSGATAIFAVMMTLTLSSLIAAAAAACYRPAVALRWLFAAGLIVSAPLLYGANRG